MFIDGDTIYSSLEKYKGKMIIFDFWATWCGPCIAGFPKLEKINEKYSDNFIVILVNSTKTKDNLDRIKEVYSLRSDKSKVDLISIIDDVYLSHFFPHIGVPFFVWITAKGSVHSFTRQEAVNNDVIGNWIKNKITLTQKVY